MRNVDNEKIDAVSFIIIEKYLCSILFNHRVVKVNELPVNLFSNLILKLCPESLIVNFVSFYQNGYLKKMYGCIQILWK